MDREEILSDSTFMTLFSIDNAITKTKEKQRLQDLAKELGCIRDFKELYNVWDKKMKHKITIDNEIVATDIPLVDITLDGGSYVCNDEGIMKEGLVVCYHPIIPAEIYTNTITGKEKVKIAFRKNFKWHSFIVDKTTISISSKIIYLSDKGVEVTSENSKALVSYFSEIINKNINIIPTQNSVSSIGWHGNDFIPYDKGTFFDGIDDFKPVYDAITTKGDYKTWFNLMTNLRANKVMQIIMAVTFASPLLEKMNIMPYVVNIYSSKSGTGKTVACMVAMSSWGNPASGALHFGTDNTLVYYTRMAAFFKNITMFCDELQIIKNNKFMPLDSFVMNLCNGKERGRGTQDNEVREMKTWHNNFLFTNNDKLAKPSFGEQTYNRILDIECNEILVHHGNSVVNLIQKNYGFGGKVYIDYIKTLGFDKIHDMFSEYYKKIVSETQSTEKQAICIASVMVANKLSQECLFKGEDELQIADIIDFVNDKEDIETWRNAYEYLLSIISVNSGKFLKSTFSNEVWGEKFDSYCKINKDILERELKKGNFEFDSVKKEWFAQGLLEKNSQGRYYGVTTVNGEKANFVHINLPKND